MSPRGAATVTVPAPRFNHPGPNDTPASTCRRAAQNLRGGYVVGGSNTAAGVAQLLDDVADALDNQDAARPVDTGPDLVVVDLGDRDDVKDLASTVWHLVGMGKSDREAVEAGLRQLKAGRLATFGLTVDEREATALAGELWNQLCRIVGDGPTRAADLAELCAHIHAIQHAVMSQAAARAHPDLFRLLGGTIGDGR